MFIVSSYVCDCDAMVVNVVVSYNLAEESSWLQVGFVLIVATHGEKKKALRNFHL